MWHKIFGSLGDIIEKGDILKCGKYHGAERQAITNGDVDAEFAASHKRVQGREKMRLPQPWDNAHFPVVKPKKGGGRAEEDICE
jgi:hypothetical protein